MTTLTTYYADFEGCDGSRGCSETQATSLEAAREYFRQRWPDARHIDVYSHALHLEREAARYEQASRQFEDYYDHDEEY